MKTHLHAQAIIEGALQEVNEAGIDGMSMRSLATRLHVQKGALYYHIDSKQTLIAAMANEVASRTLARYETEPPVDPVSRVRYIANCLRQTLREQRDGARLLAYSPLIQSTAALQLMDHLIATLRQIGVAEKRAHEGADTLMSYVTGYMLQEQQLLMLSPGSADDETFGAGLDIILCGLGIGASRG